MGRVLEVGEQLVLVGVRGWAVVIGGGWQWWLVVVHAGADGGQPVATVALEAAGRLQCCE